MVKKMEKENILIIMDQLMMENGRIIKEMEKENIPLMMNQLIKEILRMINSMEGKYCWGEGTAWKGDSYQGDWK